MSSDLEQLPKGGEQSEPMPPADDSAPFAGDSELEPLPGSSAEKENEGAQPDEDATADSAQPQTMEENKPDSEVGSIDTIANPVPAIAEQAKQSVVTVKTYSKMLQSGQKPIEEAIASGSGFVISDDGYIITNAHVVASGNLIKVVTSDGDEYTAELVGSYSPAEIAVLKVEGLDLPAVEIGDSDSVKTGELVVAIGNPLGDRLQNTVTVGYLSAESREVLLDGQEITMLQTDAAINPGNSGGPLLDSKGKVIGINTMKSVIAGMDEYGNTISAEGLSFAIPINTAMDIANELIETGSVVQPGIGFTYQRILSSDSELWEMPAGILVVEVKVGSPAYNAGLKVDDVITQIDGVDLLDDKATVPSFSERNVGDTVSAVVWRNGKEYQTEFILADISQLA